ncbi:MAG: TetR/AcrR family transcriptional regulator [Acidobacteriota bacterium]
MKRARTAQAKEERRQLLLQAALDEFYEKGFAAARTDDIAERAGLSKGTLYLYFKSKDELFTALIKNLTSPKLDQIEMMATQMPSLEMALSAFAEFAPKMIRESQMPRLMKVLIGESQAFPDIIAAYREQTLNRVLGAFATMLESARERGEIEIENPELTARLVIAPVVLSGVWQAVFSATDPEPVDLETLFKTHIRFLLKALKPGD